MVFIFKRGVLNKIFVAQLFKRPKNSLPIKIKKKKMQTRIHLRYCGWNKFYINLFNKNKHTSSLEIREEGFNQEIDLQYAFNCSYVLHNKF